MVEILLHRFVSSGVQRLVATGVLLALLTVWLTVIGFIRGRIRGSTVRVRVLLRVLLSSAATQRFQDPRRSIAALDPQRLTGFFVLEIRRTRVGARLRLALAVVPPRVRLLGERAPERLLRRGAIRHAHLLLRLTLLRRCGILLLRRRPTAVVARLTVSSAVHASSLLHLRALHQGKVLGDNLHSRTRRTRVLIRPRVRLQLTLHANSLSLAHVLRHAHRLLAPDVDGEPARLVLLDDAVRHLLLARPVHRQSHVRHARPALEVSNLRISADVANDGHAVRQFRRPSHHARRRRRLRLLISSVRLRPRRPRSRRRVRSSIIRKLRLRGKFPRHRHRRSSSARPDRHPARPPSRASRAHPTRESTSHRRHRRRRGRRRLRHLARDRSHDALDRSSRRPRPHARPSSTAARSTASTSRLKSNFGAKPRLGRVPRRCWVCSV